MSSATEQGPAKAKADQRKNLRAPLIIQKVQFEDERKVFFGYTKNIGRSGMFIATTNPAAPGEQLSLVIPLPAPIDVEVRCNCEVVWRRPLGKHLPFEPGMGVKFIDLPEELAARLEDWVKAES